MNQLGEQSERDEAAEANRCARSAIADDAQEEQEEQRQRDRHADEAELLADHGEDEVGVLLGEKCEALLRAP